MECEYLDGPRYIEGINFDADIIAAQPRVVIRQITDPVNDGSLGKPSYAEGSLNKDNTLF